MHIKKISEKLSSVVSFNKKSSNHTNPLSFKGNIVMADVFDSTKKTGIFNIITHNISQKKILLSEKFSDICSFTGNKIHSKWSAILNFGSSVKAYYQNSVDFLKNSKITFDLNNPKNLVCIDLPNSTYSVKSLMKRDVSELREEFKDLLAKKGI